MKIFIGEVPIIQGGNEWLFRCVVFANSESEAEWKLLNHIKTSPFFEDVQSLGDLTCYCTAVVA